jgi:hypothetical protein
MNMSISKKWLVNQLELFEKPKILVVVETFDIHFMHDFDFFPKNQNWWFFILKYFKELDQWLFNENSKNHATLPRS